MSIWTSFEQSVIGNLMQISWVFWDFDLETIGASYIIIWYLIFEKNLNSRLSYLTTTVCEIVWDITNSISKIYWPHDDKL